MSSLNERLRADMTAAMKAKDGLTRDTLRMVLTAVRTAETSGTTATELSDDEVQAVLTKEAKKRREAAEAFDGAGRTESAQRERDEAKVLARNIHAVLDGKSPEPLVYQTVGLMGSLGHNKGLAQVLKVRLRGFTAW